jgi:hypothetical protein
MAAEDAARTLSSSQRKRRLRKKVSTRKKLKLKTADERHPRVWRAVPRAFSRASITPSWDEPAQFLN